MTVQSPQTELEIVPSICLNRLGRRGRSDLLFVALFLLNGSGVPFRNWLCEDVLFVVPPE